MKRPIAYVAGTGRGIPAEGHDEPRLRGARASRRRTSGSSSAPASSSATSPGQGRRPARMAADGGAHGDGSAPACTAGRARRDRPQHRHARPPAARRPPSTCRRELGATRAAAFDLSAACSGWLYGMTVAEGLIASGVAETALVVGAEKMSAIVDWKDRATCVLFGDGAGAAIVRRSKRGATASSAASSAASCAATARSPSCSGARAAARQLPFSEAVLDDRSLLREDGGARGVQARRALDGRGVRSRARRRASSPAATSTS